MRWDDRCRCTAKYADRHYWWPPHQRESGALWAASVNDPQPGHPRYPVRRHFFHDVALIIEGENAFLEVTGTGTGAGRRFAVTDPDVVRQLEAASEFLCSVNDGYVERCDRVEDLPHRDFHRRFRSPQVMRNIPSTG